LIMGGSVAKFPEQNAVVAVVIPRDKNLEKEDLLKELISCGVRNRLKAFEIPWAVVVERQLAWTVENGFLTSSKKLARAKLRRHYQDLVDSEVEQRLALKREASRSAEERIYKTQAMKEILRDVLGVSRESIEN